MKQTLKDKRGEVVLDLMDFSLSSPSDLKPGEYEAIEKEVAHQKERLSRQKLLKVKDDD